MNKIIKRIISLTLIFVTAYAAMPNTNIESFTLKAYAETANTKDTLDSLRLESSGGSNIRIYDDDSYNSKNKVESTEVTKGGTYYAKTDYATVSLSATGLSSSYIKVFQGTSSSSKGKNITSNISLSSSSTTTIIVRIYSTAVDSNIRYDDKANVLSEYKLKIKSTRSDSTSSNTNSSNYDDIYLERLSVDGRSISLSESKNVYSYNVDTNVYQVSITAEPESSNDIVRINDSKVYEDEDYKRTISLNSGDNQIKIEVEDEDNNDNRIYTLNIIKGKDKVVTYKTKWIQRNGKWVYIDETGELKKNVFFNDKVNGKTYYLKFNGEMATEWNKINSYWYYFGTNGAVNTGWVYTGWHWYYMDSLGVMKTGWIFDGGKYYYLYSDGSMASNTQIGPYAVDGSGAFVR